MKRALLVAGLLVSGMMMASYAADTDPASPRHEKKMHAQNKELRDNLKKMPPEERQEAMMKLREDREEEMELKFEVGYQDALFLLKEHLTKKAKLPDAQRDALIADVEKQHQDMKSFHEKQRADRKALLDKVKNDTTLSDEQKKAALYALREAGMECRFGSRAGGPKMMKEHGAPCCRQGDEKECMEKKGK